MKIKLTKPGGWFQPDSKVTIETTEIAALSVDDDSHTEVLLRSGQKFVVMESIETVEKLCDEMMKQTATATDNPPTPDATAT